MNEFSWVAAATTFAGVVALALAIAYPKHAVFVAVAGFAVVSLGSLR